MDDTHIQKEINKYKKFKKVDGATYRKVNQFLRKRTYITAREWALARLCTDFRTSGGAEMTFIGKHLPELVPFMEDIYTPQAVNQARNSFKKKVRKASATFFYGAMCGFFSTDELDDLLFEASEVARFLLEVEGTTLDIDDEIDIEDRITKVMRGVGEAAKTILKARSEDRDTTAQSEKGQHNQKEPNISITSEQGDRGNTINIPSMETEHYNNLIPQSTQEIQTNQDTSESIPDALSNNTNFTTHPGKVEIPIQKNQSDINKSKITSKDNSITDVRSEFSHTQPILLNTKDHGDKSL
jgi:hypothetical protein